MLKTLLSHKVNADKSLKNSSKRNCQINKQKVFLCNEFVISSELWFFQNFLNFFKVPFSKKVQDYNREKMVRKKIRLLKNVF